MSADISSSVADSAPESADDFGESAPAVVAFARVTDAPITVDECVAAVENDRGHLINESADLLFHLLVLLKARNVTLEEVETALGQRTSQSGLEEKASRKRD